ncbi:hypothetical protein [Alicyclobacillus acidiphilus]|uniref:hypothetical protein n=1 Tax=Alicyclobacillus acidiphilus TaxID=182455 RepID=UPI0008299A4E|nr:hypothetical protein [Alicyclobacillus acidiphilus]
MKDMVVDYFRRGRLATTGYYKILRQQRNAYGMNIFMKFVGFPVRIFLPLLLWVIVSHTSSGDQGFKYYASYYVGVFVITLMYPYTRVATATVSTEILNGDLIRYMARGIPYWSVRFADWAASVLWYLGTVGIAFVVFAEIFMRNFSIERVVGFFVSLFIGSLIQLVLWVMIGMSAFVLEQVRGVARLYMVLQDLFTGALIPLTLLPNALGVIFEWLPFKYFVFVPLQTMLGQYTTIQVIDNAAFGLCWLAGLLVVCGLIWRQGVKHFIATQA